MSGHKDWRNNERIRRDEHLKGIKSLTENEPLWIMKLLVVVFTYYHNVSENMEWLIVATLNADLEVLARRVIGKYVCWDSVAYCLLTCYKLNTVGYSLCSNYV